jgi:Tol biopolymer transport system component
LTSGNDGESRPAWSPDGNSIAFLHILSSDRTEVMVKLLSSGREVKVADLHGSYPWLCIIPRLSWSPDGEKIYTSGSIGTKDACSVIAIDVATRSLQPITQPGSIGDLEAAVSPDGTQVAFLRNTGTLGGDIYVTPIEGGTTRRVTFDNRDIMGFCWLTDGSGFIVSSRRGDGVPKLWQISLDGKSAKPLTDGLTLAAFPSMSAQGDRLAFTAYRTTTSIW